MPIAKMLRTKGFTLVELLIVAVLTVIVAGGLLTAFLTGQTSYFSADAYIQVQQEARRGFDAMVRELREAGPFGVGTEIDDANPLAIAPLSNNQLHFQVAMEYTSAIQWGDGQVQGTNNWVHYVAFTNTSLANPNPAVDNRGQLLRCTNDNANALTGTNVIGPAVPANCRVLANNIVVPDAAPFMFQLDSPPRIVTINLQVRYSSRLLPGGFQRLGTQATPLTSRVRLRNAT